MEKKHNIDKFQGYPHYPASEDITRAANNNGKESLDDTPLPKYKFNNTIDERDEEMLIVAGTETDITAEELRMLEAAEQNIYSTDNNNLMHAMPDIVDEDGELLNEDSLDSGMTGEDLDVPGSTSDDADEDIGEEDEENNYYSLGGDNHEAQEENKGE